MEGAPRRIFGKRWIGSDEMSCLSLSRALAPLPESADPSKDEDGIPTCTIGADPRKPRRKDGWMPPGHK